MQLVELTHMPSRQTMPLVLDTLSPVEAFCSASRFIKEQRVQGAVYIKMSAVPAEQAEIFRNMMQAAQDAQPTQEVSAPEASLPPDVAAEAIEPTPPSRSTGNRPSLRLV